MLFLTLAILLMGDRFSLPHQHHLNALRKLRRHPRLWRDKQAGDVDAGGDFLPAVSD